MKERLAIFASGRGSNAEKIIQYLSDNPSLDVGLIVSNKSSAGVLQLARRYGISTYLFNRDQQDSDLITALKNADITWIALAGYLKKISLTLIDSYPDRIVNIHPALLPKYGGAGMYGHHVHNAVSESGDNQSGMTIHFVNEQYDEGEIIFQAECDIPAHADASIIASEVLKLEHQYYPRIIATLMAGDIPARKNA